MRQDNVILDRHQYESATYKEYSESVDAACAWLKSIGIEFSATRVGKYQRIFKDLAAAYESKDYGAFSDKYRLPQVANAMHECAELLRLYDGLRGRLDDQLTKRLKQSLRGHELYVLDNSDCSGRDFSLELSMAARFARHGCEIDFGHSADLHVWLSSGQELFVECKRLKSWSKVERRAKEGLKQLDVRYAEAAASNSMGLLALSIGKLVNKDLGFLQGRTPRELGDNAFEYSKAFIERYRYLWQLNIDPRTLGVAVILDSPGIFVPSQVITSCHQVTVNNSSLPGTPGHEMLYRLAVDVLSKEPD